MLVVALFYAEVYILVRIIMRCNNTLRQGSEATSHTGVPKLAGAVMVNGVRLPLLLLRALLDLSAVPSPDHSLCNAVWSVPKVRRDD